MPRSLCGPTELALDFATARRLKERVRRIEHGHSKLAVRWRFSKRQGGQPFVAKSTGDRQCIRCRACVKDVGGSGRIASTASEKPNQSCSPGRDAGDTRRFDAQSVEG